MAIRPRPNYEPAKALYLKDMPWPEIARQTGIHILALKKHAQRHKWTELKTRTRDAIASVVEKTASLGLQSNVEGWLSKVDLFCNKLMDELLVRGIADMKAKDIRDMVAALFQANQMFRQRYGLDQDQAGRTSIGLVQIVVQPQQTSQFKALRQMNEITIDNTPEVEADTPTTEPIDVQASSVD